MEVQSVGDSILYLVLIGTMGAILLASSVIFFYIRSQKHFIRQQAALQAAELKHRKVLLNATVQSQENERVRISKDLHDNVCASLSGIRLLVSQILHDEVGSETIKNIADDTRTGIDAIIEEVRNLSHNLSPAGLELWGFNEALEGYCDKVSESSDLDIIINNSAEEVLTQFSFEQALLLFRVMQELINNTIKHAEAQSICIDIKKMNNRVVLSYVDDGKGVDMSNDKSQGIGMYNIESRLSIINADYNVQSSLGNGYIFNINIPVPTRLTGNELQYG